MSSVEFWSAALERIELFPTAICVAFLANSSGFSGGVLFQPIIYFTQGLPLAQSVSTGIATETIGMSSGATRYHLMKVIDWRPIRSSLVWVFIGVIGGYLFFKFASPKNLKTVLGCVLIGLSLLKFYELLRPSKQRPVTEKPRKLAALFGILGGAGSASTGTGVCELHQPFFERKCGMPVVQANASAIATEAWGNICISILNLSFGLVDFSVLVWTGPGALIGAQLGAFSSKWIPTRFMKAAFSVCVFIIGSFYLYQTLR
jgi:uncharacterized membrane protein YfcA